MKSKQQQAEALWQAGHHNYAQIGRMVGASTESVWFWLGCKHDADQWEQDRQRHAEFFGGLSPASEYRQHAQRRRELNDKLEGESV